VHKFLYMGRGCAVTIKLSRGQNPGKVAEVYLVKEIFFIKTDHRFTHSDA